MTNSTDNGKHPGPWVVAMLSKPQLRPYYAVREIDIGFSYPGHEHLHGDDGERLSFETAEEANAAIVKATGTAV